MSNNNKFKKERHTPIHIKKTVSVNTKGTFSSANANQSSCLQVNSLFFHKY